MSTDQTRRVLELVDQALDREASRRAAWLHEACAGDVELEQEVLELLRLEPDARSFLDAAGEDGAATLPRMRAGAPSDAAEIDLRPGSRIGDFQIEQHIGAGGMGVVFQARQISLNRPVALKALPVLLRSSPSANARFRREIEAAARLHHTHIVSVYATGEDAGTLYYAMELIDGPPLSHVLEHLRTHPIGELASATPHDEYRVPSGEHSRATPPWAIQSLTGVGSRADQRWEPAQKFQLDGSGGSYFDRVAHALADVADALHYAHDRDVVHRDVKPSNLLLSSDGRLHVSDFGLARFLQDPGLTQTGECLGTPFYMAPEQVSTSSDAIDGRSDVYGLGATLYEMLTLQPPFIGDTRERIIAQIANCEPTAPRRINRRVPHDLQTICLKALEKDPTDRYPTAGAMADDLRAYAAQFAISARRSGPIVKVVKWARRHRGLAWALGAAACLALTAVFFAWRAHRSQSLWTEAQQTRVFEQALLAALEGNGSQAQTAVDEARRLGAPPGRVLLLEGQVDLLAARWIDAHDHFRDAAAALPENVAAQSLFARCCMIRQFYEEGETVYQRIQSLEARSADDFLHRARIEAYFDAEKAVETLGAAIDRNRASLVARLLRGDVLVGRALDSAGIAPAEAALADFRIVKELLGDTPLVTSKYMMALLAAATAHESNGSLERRDDVLDEARATAQKLIEIDTFQAHRILAFYYDYLGQTELAIQQWRKFQHRQILFLVLTLVREGRFDEAVDACEQVERGERTDRMLSFFRMLILAASADDPAGAREAFPISDQVELDPIHELLTVYSRTSLLDSPAEARRRCQALAQKQRIPTLRRNWYEHLEKFASGEIDGGQLLAAAGDSRKNRCEAGYYLGMAELAAGRRDAARNFFQQSTQTRVFNYFEFHLSRLLLSLLHRDPAWPRWIEADPS